MAKLDKDANKVRKMIMNQILLDGTCPTRNDIQHTLSITNKQMDRIFIDLEAAICIAIQNKTHVGMSHFQEEKLLEPLPDLGEIFHARPFATFKNHYPVQVQGIQKWYCECAVEACGISSMFPNKEVIVHSICRQTKEPVQITGKNGIILDYHPKTLRVHFGYPIRDMANDSIGWCDYNSFFYSEEAADKWKKSHPEINGITRDPVTVSNFVSLISRHRLDDVYQIKIPILRIIFQPQKYGLLRTLFKIKIPDFFFIPTWKMIACMRKKGYKNFFSFSLL